MASRIRLQHAPGCGSGYRLSCAAALLPRHRLSGLRRLGCAGIYKEYSVIRSFAPARALVLSLVLLLALLAPASRVASTPPAHAAGVPSRGGTLVAGLQQAPDQLLPNFSRQYYALSVQQTLFAPLFYSDRQGTIHPGLAEVVPSLANGGISRDGLTYTIHLRPGLHWSDGASLTARDVDFSWKLWVDPKTAGVASTLGFDHISSSTISADGLTIVFHLAQPYAPFISDWTDAPGPLPAHVLRGIPPAKIVTGAFARHPNVNSGPFTLSGTDTAQEILVSRNPAYYGSASGYPYLSHIDFRVFAGEFQLLVALQKHQVDTAWLLPIADLAMLRRMGGVRTLALHDDNWEAAIINFRNPVLQDVRVRRALQIGLDRGAEVSFAWQGMASLLGSDQPAGSPVADPAVAPYPYDPGRAGRLLDAAGWHLGADGLRHKGSAALTLTYSTTFANPWRQVDELQALHSYEALGIQLEIRNYPAATFFDQILPKGEFDLAETAFSNQLDPDNTAIFGTRYTYPRGSNYGSFSDPEFDRLAGAELTTVDPRKRQAIFFSIQKRLHDDAPVVWLYSPYDLAAASGRAHNYSPAPFGLDTWNAWEWWVDKGTKG
jgi:peptide/nickel transport system substrate-binding protein